jgi:hypothetical protein
MLKNDVQVTKELEPVGIVISRGTREEPRSAFTAYIWGPVPDRDTTDPIAKLS